MRLTRRLFLFAVGLVALAGCGPAGTGGGRFTQPGKLKVLATYSILGDLVRNVAGDSAEVLALVGPDGDAHTFDPSPQDGMTVADCGVIFENGAGFETWLDDLYSSYGAKAPGTRLLILALPQVWWWVPVRMTRLPAQDARHVSSRSRPAEQRPHCHDRDHHR
jgi:hypothetical protein